MTAMQGDIAPAPRARSFRTVRGRLLFWILAVTVPIYAGALYLSYEATARRLEEDATRDVDEVAARLAADVDAVIRQLEGGIRTVAFQLEEVDPPPTQYAQRILGVLKAWPQVYGSTIAVETGAGAKPFAPYYFRRGKDIAYADLADAAYAYHQLPWYRRAAESRQANWSAPYFDAGGGNVWMLTYAVPFFRTIAGQGQVLAGVVTADLALDWVRGAAEQASLGPIGLGWLASPAADEAFVAPIGATPQRLPTFDRGLDQAAVQRAGEDMLARQVRFGLVPASVTATPAYLAVRPVGTLGWRILLVIPRAELLAEARTLLNRQLWLGAIGLVLLVAAISAAAAGITRPIQALAAAVAGARHNDLDLQLPERPRRDEIGVLTEALRRMRGALQEHVQLRAASLAEQGRLAHELEIAASIQQSMLPGPGTAGVLPSGVQVAAALLPAKQVGGDLYDYFPLHDGSLLLAIGDVSDKGIPAALFMARLSALLRVLGAAGEPPDRLMAGINTRLTEGNDACMFVTMGCGVLDPASGRIRYASAGHELPLVLGVDGEVRTLASEGGAALGIDFTSDYVLGDDVLAPGDTLLLVTDGVTEAHALDGADFGVDRLSRVLRDSPPGDAAALVRRVVDAVAAFAPHSDATDDLTVLAVRWTPAGVRAVVDGGLVTWHLAADANPAGLAQAQRHLRAILNGRAVDPGVVADVELVAEEVLTNIVRSAGRPGAGATRLAIECVLGPSEITLTVRDDGPAFDPLGRPPPDLDADIAVREVGGLGIALVTQLAAGCRYARLDGWNVLVVRVSRKSDSR
jgi:sigma-B regulation protein RsbU (phosphoserine phosphatase)